VNISKLVPINISRTPDVVENVFIGAECSQEEICKYMARFKEFRNDFSWSYEEIPSMDPQIVEHEIRRYKNVKPVQQKLRPVKPRKAVAIKAKVEKFHKVGFIYKVSLTKWVSNPIPVDKK